MEAGILAGSAAAPGSSPLPGKGVMGAGRQRVRVEVPHHARAGCLLSPGKNAPPHPGCREHTKLSHQLRSPAVLTQAGSFLDESGALCEENVSLPRQN